LKCTGNATIKTLLLAFVDGCGNIRIMKKIFICLFFFLAIVTLGGCGGGGGETATTTTTTVTTTSTAASTTTGTSTTTVAETTTTTDTSTTTTITATTTTTSTTIISFAIETIDGQGFIAGSYCHIRVDNNNNPHISYYDSTNLRLRYANVATSWKEVVYDVGLTSRNNLAIDSNNKIHLVCYDNNNTRLEYISGEAGFWHESAVDASGWASELTMSGIAVDQQNRPLISYYKTSANNPVVVANNASGSWTADTVVEISQSSNNDTINAIAIDTNGKQHVLFVKNALHYANNVSGAWQIQATIESSDSGNFIAQNASFALGPDNVAHVCYMQNINPNYYFIYANNLTGSWVKETLFTSTETIGIYNSLAIDATGKVHISFTLGDNSRSLNYLTNINGPWHVTTVEALGVDQYSWNSIDVDNYCRPHIAFYDEVNRDLKYAAPVAQ